MEARKGQDQNGLGSRQPDPARGSPSKVLSIVDATSSIDRSAIDRVSVGGPTGGASKEA